MNHWKIGICMTLSLLGSWSFSGDSSLENLRLAIEQATTGQKATYGVAFTLVGSGTSFSINGQDQMHAASTMKVPVMMRLFEMMDQGKLALDTELTVKNAFQSIVDGSPYAITVDSEEHLYSKIGKKVTLETLIVAMITKSSNLATNILIELADPQAIMSLMHRFDIKHMQVLRGVEDLKAFEANRNNESSAAAMLKAMVAAVEAPHFSATSRSHMLRILRMQAFKDMIPAGVPQASGAKIANKTGAISRVQHDAAIIDLADGRRYGLVVFARDFKDEREQVKATARKISRLVFDYVTQQ